MKEFWCEEGKHWVTASKDDTGRGARRKHAEEHTAERVMFARDDLRELDATLNGWYGS